jgi:hypothetical protein
MAIVGPILRHIVVLGVVCVLCSPHGPRAIGQTRSRAHAHVDRADVLAEIKADVTVARVALDADAERDNVTRSSNGRYTAFTVSGETERLLIEDSRNRAVWEVLGLPLGHRPFSDLHWTGRRLVFDRWSQPHHGVHYELDVDRRELVVAYAFPDR